MFCRSTVRTLRIQICIHQGVRTLHFGNNVKIVVPYCTNKYMKEVNSF
jgi:hypothetical protein